MYLIFNPQSGIVLKTVLHLIYIRESMINELTKMQRLWFVFFFNDINILIYNLHMVKLVNAEIKIFKKIFFFLLKL